MGWTSLAVYVSLLVVLAYGLLGWKLDRHINLTHQPRVVCTYYMREAASVRTPPRLPSPGESRRVQSNQQRGRTSRNGCETECPVRPIIEVACLWSSWRDECSSLSCSA